MYLNMSPVRGLDILGEKQHVERKLEKGELLLNKNTGIDKFCIVYVFST